MFDLRLLGLKIMEYGINRFVINSHIPLDRLANILDGDDYFTLGEVNIAMALLEIKPCDKDLYFFEVKVDTKQLLNVG